MEKAAIADVENYFSRPDLVRRETLAHVHHVVQSYPLGSPHSLFFENEAAEKMYMLAERGPSHAVRFYVFACFGVVVRDVETALTMSDMWGRRNMDTVRRRVCDILLGDGDDARPEQKDEMSQEEWLIGERVRLAFESKDDEHRLFEDRDVSTYVRSLVQKYIRSGVSSMPDLCRLVMGDTRRRFSLSLLNDDVDMFILKEIFESVSGYDPSLFATWLELYQSFAIDEIEK
jgi:hypothetical protein